MRGATRRGSWRRTSCTPSDTRRRATKQTPRYTAIKDFSTITGVIARSDPRGAPTAYEWYVEERRADRDAASAPLSSKRKRTVCLDVDAYRSRTGFHCLLQLSEADAQDISAFFITEGCSYARLSACQRALSATLL